MRQSAATSCTVTNQPLTRMKCLWISKKPWSVAPISHTLGPIGQGPSQTSILLCVAVPVHLAAFWNAADHHAKKTECPTAPCLCINIIYIFHCFRPCSSVASVSIFIFQQPALESDRDNLVIISNCFSLNNLAYFEHTEECVYKLHATTFFFTFWLMIHKLTIPLHEELFKSKTHCMKKKMWKKLHIQFNCCPNSGYFEGGKL